MIPHNGVSSKNSIIIGTGANANSAATLSALGWNDHWQEKFSSSAAQGLVPGRVIGEHRSHYQVGTGSEELNASLKGRLRNSARDRSDLPGVGDFVALRRALTKGQATIEVVLPRATALIRVASGERRPQLLGANIDLVFLVTAPDRDFNVARIERYLALIGASGATPVIVINKSDLAGDVAGMTAQVAAIAPATPIHVISALEENGVRGLVHYFAGNKTIGLFGSSGVGKSTMTNQLLGRSAQAIQDVRAYDSRGRHTTTHRQLFTRLGGGVVMDTPGMRGMEAWTEKVAEKNFDDIENLATRCKFRNCRHDSEPGCAVRVAVEQGMLQAARHSDYVSYTRGR